MGRRPNPLILEFFERGAKLNDNSNRYHHRCKACGEDFPKGRSDSLTAHLTKKCPAISQADRVNACLTLHGLNNSSNRAQYDGLLHTDPNQGPGSLNGLAPSLEQSQHLNQTHNQNQNQNQIWTPLETLAEVSRQIEANEKHDDYIPTTLDSAAESIQTTSSSTVPTMVSTATTSSNPFELHEQFTMEHPPTNLSNHPQRDSRDLEIHQQSFNTAPNMPPASDRTRQSLITSDAQEALSIAAAAATRLNTSLLDPQLLADEAIHEPVHHQPQQSQSMEIMIDYTASPEKQRAPVYPATSATPWEGMTYISEDIHAPATVNDHGDELAATLSRGGHRMNSHNGARHRHNRARFDPSRRREVQEVRRIGACIRCRILRKTCSNGTPCAACKRVLSPRVWRTGCVRTTLSEHIDLYSAGVQAVMSQKRINGYKTTHHLDNNGVSVEVSHFPDTNHKAVFQVLQGIPKESDDGLPSDSNPIRVLLLDNNAEDIPGKVEAYMRDALPELIRREPSHYVRVTLDMAVEVANDTNDEMLKRSLELWGIVEMMDLERHWTMLAKSPEADVKDYWIKDGVDSEAYTNISLQLTAAAERKASTASKSLLSGIQRYLQDGKMKLGFPMFLTVMLFLNCMEKTTWAFKVWDEENLRPKWPLEKPPSDFTQQGQELTELLRMLLVIRHILPKAAAPDPHTPIMAAKDDHIIRSYFEHLGVTQAYLHSRREQNNFQPEDSRSLEFLFCSSLLLNN
ncbi:hypothetical protein F4804DRAFT_304837 [Jackrogersella minutella]|nr:hypothetical protein F4804DRAFT_304837 [Jackrogersella minutella]